jgi:hypothetical protein
MLAWIMLRYDGWLVHAKLNCDVFMTLTNDITPVDGMKYMIYSYPTLMKGSEQDMAKQFWAVAWMDHALLTLNSND